MPSTPAPRRPPYTHGQLARMLNPGSIAILGASPRPGAFGDRVLQNLAQFTGRIHLVNAKYAQVGERPCHPSVAALPESPDLAVVVVGREAVEGVVRECMEAGAGGVMVFASGYGETGKADRIAQQARLAQLARDGGVPLIGPNCIGVVHYALKCRASFSLAADLPPPDDAAVGIVSQSGALGFGLEQSIYRGVAISHMLNSGNSADVDMADFVSYLADEPTCQAIALLFEGMADPLRLMQACRYAWSRGKPVVAYKIAVGETGAQAAMSHTGALAGSQAGYRAAFDRAGVVMVDRLECLLETARFLAKAPAPQAPGVAVMASSGGAAIMAADFADVHGVALPQPGERAQALLDTVIPDFGSARNPVDLTAQVLNDEAMVPQVAEALLADPAYGALVIPSILSSASFVPRVAAWGGIARRLGKPVIDVWTTEWLQGPMSMELEREPGVSLFRSMDRAFAAIAAWQRHHARRQEASDAPGRASPPDAAAQARDFLAATSTDVLAERQAKSVLALYGVPVVHEVLVHGAAQADEVARAMAGPVALKVDSPDLPHKTEAGVIRLGVQGSADVRAAYDAVMANASLAAPQAQVHGVLVQPMVPAGLEIVVGGRVDPLFGPLVAVGLGGVFVELLGDAVIAQAPVTPRQALRMIAQLKGQRVLDGFRGAPGVDREALAAVVCRASEFMADQAATVSELDINPLIAHGARLVAVDALIVKQAT